MAARKAAAAYQVVSIWAGYQICSQCLCLSENEPGLTLCLLLWSDRSHLLSVRQSASAGTGHSDKSTSRPKSRDFQNKRFVRKDEELVLQSWSEIWRTSPGRGSCCLFGIITLSPTRSVPSIHTPRLLLCATFHSFRMGQMNFPLSLPQRAAVGQWRSALCCVKTLLTVGINQTLSGAEWSAFCIAKLMRKSGHLSI